MRNIFNIKRNFFFFSFLIIISIFGVYHFSKASESCANTLLCNYTVSVNVNGQRVTNVSGSPAAGQNIAVGANCNSSGLAQVVCGTSSNTVNNPGLVAQGALGLNTSYTINVPGSSNPDYIANSITVKCGSRSSEFPLIGGQANLGGMRSSFKDKDNCDVVVNYVGVNTNSGTGAPSCPDYKVASCDMGQCVERDSSNDCTAVSSCDQQYGCNTTIGVNVSPSSVTVAPGETATYNVEVSQNFMTNAPIWGIILNGGFGSPLGPGYGGSSFANLLASGQIDDVTWEVPSDQQSKVKIDSINGYSKEVHITMNAPSIILRVKIRTNPSIPISTRSFGVVAVADYNPQNELRCWGTCEARVNNSSLIVQSPMTGTLTASPNPCTISAGQSSCTTTGTWSVTNPENPGGSAITATGMTDVGLNDSTIHSGTKTLTVPHGGRTFYLYNSGKSLVPTPPTGAGITVGAECATNTSWDGSKCATVSTTVPKCEDSITSPPSAGQCSNRTSTGFNLNWTPASPSNSYTRQAVRVSSNETSVNNGSCVNTDPTNCKDVALNASTFTATGLTPNTTYYNRIAAVCQNADGSSGIKDLKWTCTTTPTSCQNGAINPSACTECPTGFTMVNGTCTQSCSNGATNPPTCTTCPTGFTMINGTCTQSCPNGATNPPTCTTCPAGYTMVNGVCTIITITPQMTGTLMPHNPSCAIARGEKECNVNLSWATQNPEGISRITSSLPQANTDVTPQGSGDYSGSGSFSVPHSGRDFYLYNNQKKLDESHATATCTGNDVWDQSNQKCKAPSGNVCENGATNPPTCNLCPDGYPPVNNTCVRPEMSGELLAEKSSCSILEGESSCMINFSWNTVHPLGTSKVTRVSDGIVVGNGNTNSGAFVIKYSPQHFETFVLSNSSQTLDQKTVSADCELGTRFDAGKCISTGGNVMAGELSASSCTIQENQKDCTTTAHWGVINPENPGGSEITAANMSAIKLNDLNVHSGTKTLTVPYPSRTFFLYNHEKSLVPVSPNGTGLIVSAECIDGTDWDQSSQKCKKTTVAVSKGTIRGLKVDKNGNNFNTSGVSVSVSGASSNSSSNNPFYFNDIPTGSYTISSSPKTGYDIFYNYSKDVGSTWHCANFCTGSSFSISLAKDETVDVRFMYAEKTTEQANTTGILLANPYTCTIHAGESNCTTILHWETYNPPQGAISAVTSPYPQNNTIIENGNSGDKEVTIPHLFSTLPGPLSGPVRFFLYNSGNKLAEIEVKTVCATGTEWDSGEGKCLVPGGGLTNGPDLSAGVVTPATAVVDVGQKYYSTISNTGNKKTNKSFYNFFQKATLPGGNGTITDLPASEMGALSPGETDVTESPTIIFNLPGVYSIRACADKSDAGDAGLIAELNEEDNCSPWTNVSVTDASSASDLIITDFHLTDQNGNTAASFTPNEKIYPSVTIKNVGTEKTEASGGSFTITVFAHRPSEAMIGGISDTDIYITDPNPLQAGESRTYSENINSGLWSVNNFTMNSEANYTARVFVDSFDKVREANEANNQSVSNYAVFSDNSGSGISIDADPDTIFSGQQSRLYWSSIYGSCDGINFSTNGRSSGEVTVRPNTTTTYTITCGNKSKSKTVVVKRQPWYKEN